MSDPKAAKERRIEELIALYRARGFGQGTARYKAKRRYEVEGGPPGPMAWLGGIFTAITSWGLIPIGFWVWEQIIDTPGHARFVLRTVGLMITFLVVVAAAIIAIALVASNGGDGPRLSQRQLETALEERLGQEIPSGAIDEVDCPSGITAGQAVECVIGWDGYAHPFEISATEDRGGLNLLVDLVD